MERQISLVKEEALAACRGAQTSAELEAIRVKYLGKKGEITQLLRGMGKVPPEERPRMGKLVNEARDELERALGAAGRKLAALEEERRLERERVDITLPGRRPPWAINTPSPWSLRKSSMSFGAWALMWFKAPKWKPITTISRPSMCPNSIRRGICRTLST